MRHVLYYACQTWIPPFELALPDCIENCCGTLDHIFPYPELAAFVEARSKVLACHHYWNLLDKNYSTGNHHHYHGGDAVDYSQLADYQLPQLKDLVCVTCIHK